jgi:hypothetical protein
LRTNHTAKGETGNGGGVWHICATAADQSYSKERGRARGRGAAHIFAAAADQSHSKGGNGQWGRGAAHICAPAVDQSLNKRGNGQGGVVLRTFTRRLRTDHTAKGGNGQGGGVLRIFNWIDVAETHKYSESSMNNSSIQLNGNSITYLHFIYRFCISSIILCLCCIAQSMEIFKATHSAMGWCT